MLFALQCNLFVCSYIVCFQNLYLRLISRDPTVEVYTNNDKFGTYLLSYKMLNHKIYVPIIDNVFDFVILFSRSIFIYLKGICISPQSIHYSVNRKSNVFALLTPTEKSNENLILTGILQKPKQYGKVVFKYFHT